MTSTRPFLRRYRFVLLALAASAAIHAAIIVGIPGRGGIVEPEAIVYSATLDPAAMEAVQAAPTPAPAPPRRARPRPKPPASPPRPEEMVAQAPEMQAPPPAAEPDRAPEPELPPEPPKPEVVALAAPVAPPPPALEPEPFPEHALPGRMKVTYALSSAIADGKASYEWQRDGDDYVISGEAQAEGFFTLFLEGRVLQESRGKVTKDGLRPDRFTESRPQTADEGLAFDWNARKVTFQRGTEKNVADLNDNTVDWLSMIFQLAHRPPTGESFDLRVFTQRRLYQFKLKVLGEEEIEIPLGKVRALHLRHVDAEKNELVDVWLGVAQHYLPVKMRYPVARNRIMVEQTAIRISDQ